MLHIILGLVGNLVNYIYDFAHDHIEHVEPALVAAEAEVQTARQNLELHEEEHKQIPKNGTRAEQKEHTRTRNAAKLRTKALKSALACAKKKLTSASKVRTLWTVHNALNNIFGSKGIARNQYHSNSLNGEHCNRFLEHWPVLCPAVTALFTGPLRRPAGGATDVQCAHFTDVISEAVEVLYFIREIMYSMQPQSAETRHCFRQAAEYYGQLLRREDKLHASVTMKAHVLESHCPDYLDRYHRLGIFSEQVMEREHAEMKILERQYGNERVFNTRQRNIMTSITRSMIPGVAEHELLIYNSKKRVYSPATQQRREEEEQEAEEENAQRRASIIELLNNINFDNE